MNKRTYATITGVLVAAGLALAGCGAGGMPPADDGTVVMKTNPPYGPDHMMSKAMTNFAEVLGEESNGQYTFEHYYADSLVKQPEVAESLNAGLIDLGYLGMAYTPATYPIDAWASQVGYGGDDRPVVGLLADAAAMVEWSYTVPQLSEELEKSGIYPLLPRLQNHDNYQMLCKEPVTSLADAAGKRVRVGGQLYSKTVESLGMSPVTLSGAEIYEGFERGVVDCFVGAEPDMTGLGLWEVGTEFVKVGFPGWNSISLASSETYVASLPPELKQVLDDNRARFLQIYFEGYFDEKKKFYQGAEEMEIQIHEPEADLQQAIDDHFASIQADMISNAPASIEDPEGVVRSYEEIRNKWIGIVEELGYDGGYKDYTQWATELGDGSVDLGPWAEKLDQEVFSIYPAPEPVTR